MSFLRTLLASWILTLAVLLSTPVHAGPAEDLLLASTFSQQYPSILVDARGSRGGNGDIAAAYLTVSDWLSVRNVTSHFTIVVDENGKNRLRNLAHGNALFSEHVQIVDAADVPATYEFSMYVVFANPSGTYRYASDIGTTFRMKKDAAFIVQTVLGNTENRNSLQPNAIIEKNGRVYEWAPAGLAANESGIYTDIVAQKLRPMNLSQVRADVLSNLDLVTDSFSKESLVGIVSGEKLKGAKPGLVYGISSAQTQKQFMTYLQGLASQVDHSFVLFTPSSFREEHLTDSDLKDKVVFLTSTDQIPVEAETNKIYVVETKTLPHKVFVGLMALSMKSGVVPVGAGDGFMSAAIDLGGPFVLTQVPWNRANVAALKGHILRFAHEHGLASADITMLKELLKRNYELVDFQTASALKKFAPLFALLKPNVLRLSTRLMEVAVAGDFLTTPSSMPRIQDMTLQTSVLRGGRKSSLNLPTSHQASSRLTCEAAF